MNSEAKIAKRFWRRRFAWLCAASLVVFIAEPASRNAASADRIGIFEDHTDVGVTLKSGGAAYDAKRHEYTVTGGGENMWGTADAFHFVWKRVSGDVSISAGVALRGTDGNEHRKAGLMIRQGLGAGDAYADAVVHGDGLTSLQYRETEGAETKEVRAETTAPRFLRLERHGNEFTLIIAEDGRHFSKIGSATVALHDPVYVGLAVCSHNAEALLTAVFREVKAGR